DLLSGRPGEGLRAVSALQQKRVSGCCAGQAVAKIVDLTGEHQRRKSCDLLRHIGDAIAICPDGLLLDGKGAPDVKVGIVLLRHSPSLLARRAVTGVSYDGASALSPKRRKRRRIPADRAAAERP